MAFANIVTMNITRGNIAVARQGFGVPMLAHYHTKTSARVEQVVSTEDAISALGFSRAVDQDAALLAKLDQVFSQTPRPPIVKIGRLQNGNTFVFTLTVGAVVAGDHVKVNFMGTDIDLTVGGGDTPTTMATALAAAINAIRVGAAASAAAVVTVTGVSGAIYQFKNWSQNLSVKNTSANTNNIATDLGTIFAADPDFFGFDLVNDSDAIGGAAAAWGLANKRMFFPTVCDSECKDSGVTTDLGSDLKALLNNWTGVFFSGTDSLSALGFALFCKMGAAYTPGQETFAHKRLDGIAPETTETLTTSQAANLENKNINFFAPYLGLPTTWPGKVASGEWIDVTRGLAALESDMQRGVFSQITGADGKVAFTSLGIDFICNAARAVLKSYTEDPNAGRSNLLAADPAPAITLPNVANVSTADKQARNLPGIPFTATLAGAIHTTVIDGTISV